MKTKKIIIVIVTLFAMVYMSNTTSMSNNDTATSIIATSSDNDLLCDTGNYSVHIEYIGNPTASQKTAIRNSFNVYGRHPLHSIESDGSERWIFILENMSSSVEVSGQCNRTTVDMEIEDDEDVKKKRVEVRSNR